MLAVELRPEETGSPLEDRRIPGVSALVLRSSVIERWRCGVVGVLTQEQKDMAFRLEAEGLSLVAIARQVGCTAPMIGLMTREGRFLTGLPDAWEPREAHLTVTEREQILLGLDRVSRYGRSAAGWGGRRRRSHGRSPRTGAGRGTGRGSPTGGPGMRLVARNRSSSKLVGCWRRSRPGCCSYGLHRRSRGGYGRTSPTILRCA